ncbi:outer membrane putative beta-barrel porin/alpha-amylase [Neolewinella xylanilytica]|uniref:Outer membrane putative beta-barrel porin/alpha-amylase n=1 Tax=Neolewinella xylanilytica TaxID=1514080 RepID=A0A2S6I992_9BACT|nr:transporter [Neolewinella xylanilytica]PPK88039.1 outer membrane putative beta-barrel porin/alpha-amylase [Neolewinella xylanilytica]
MKFAQLFLCLLLPVLLAAQYRPTIVTGRPGQSIGGLTVGRRVYQIQTGLNVNWIGEGADKRTNLTETTVIRVGLLDHLELSGVIAGASVASAANGRTTRERGISNTQLGLRYNLLQNAGWRPSLAVQGRALLTAQDEAFRRDHTGANFIVSAGWSLTSATGLTLNLHRSWSGNNTRTTGYTSALGFSLGENWSSFVEMYGSLSDGATANFDGGFGRLVGDNLLLDVSAGWQGRDGLTDYFIDFGLSFRIDGREAGDDFIHSRINEN